MWLTEYHQKYKCVQPKNCESGLAKACCTQAGPSHFAGHVEMAWTDKSHLLRHALSVAPIAVARRGLSPVTGTVSQVTKTNSIVRLPCGYLYHSRHWMGKSMSSLCPCCHHEGGRLFIVLHGQTFHSAERGRKVREPAYSILVHGIRNYFVSH